MSRIDNILSKIEGLPQCPGCRSIKLKPWNLETDAGYPVMTIIGSHRSRWIICDDCSHLFMSNNVSTRKDPRF